MARSADSIPIIEQRGRSATKSLGRKHWNFGVCVNNFRISDLGA